MTRALTIGTILCVVVSSSLAARVQQRIKLSHSVAVDEKFVHEVDLSGKADGVDIVGKEVAIEIVHPQYGEASHKIVKLGKDHMATSQDYVVEPKYTVDGYYVKFASGRRSFRFPDFAVSVGDVFRTGYNVDDEQYKITAVKNIAGRHQDWRNRHDVDVWGKELTVEGTGAMGSQLNFKGSFVFAMDGSMRMMYPPAVQKYEVKGLKVHEYVVRSWWSRMWSSKETEVSAYEFSAKGLFVGMTITKTSPGNSPEEWRIARVDHVTTPPVPHQGDSVSVNGRDGKVTLGPDRDGDYTVTFEDGSQSGYLKAAAMTFKATGSPIVIEEKHVVLNVR